MSDRWGRKPFIVSGMLLLAATLALFAVGDVAHPAGRADSDLYGIRAAVRVVAALTAVSGAVVAVRMYETHQRSATATCHPESVG